MRGELDGFMVRLRWECLRQEEICFSMETSLKVYGADQTTPRCFEDPGGRSSFEEF